MYFYRQFLSYCMAQQDKHNYVAGQLPAVPREVRGRGAQREQPAGRSQVEMQPCYHAQGSSIF